MPSIRQQPRTGPHIMERCPMDSNATASHKDALTLYDLAERWGVSYATVHDLARRDALPVPTFRVGRRYLVSRRAYDAVMNAQHEPEPQSA